MVNQKDSIIELSTLEATRPMDPSSPASRSRWPKTQDVYWLPRSEWTTVPGPGRHGRPRVRDRRRAATDGGAGPQRAGRRP